MGEIVFKYVKGYVFCVTIKPTRRKSGMYTTLITPSHPWDNISMDFLRGFPMAKRGHDYLYVIVDMFRKMCTFMPCKKQATTK